MKSHYLLLFSTLVFLIASCTKEEQDPELVNTWKLLEVLADPGDGSGTFQPVTSNKTVSFFEDGTLSSNGSLCTMDPQVGNGSTGTYSIADSTITVNNCVSVPYPMTFDVNGAELILNYPCIEPCREKYELVE